MKYLLVLDQSTTHARALVMDYRGRPISIVEKEITQIYPHPGWVEHDPNEIWSAQIGVASKALHQANLCPEDIAAVGIANRGARGQPEK
jgi:glycerol kinase